MEHYGRSIPTCAGQPPTHCLRHCTRWVYPHVCGAAFDAIALRIISLGLSPRVRGNLAFPSLRIPARRSIPTCAGEPWSTVSIGISMTVYPHVCGGTLHKLICGLGLYSPTECLCLAIFFFETVNPLYGAVILTPERPTHKEACGKAVGRLCLLRLRILVPRAGAGIPRSCEQLGARPSYSKMTEYPKAMM